VSRCPLTAGRCDHTKQASGFVSREAIKGQRAGKYQGAGRRFARAAGTRASANTSGPDFTLELSLPVKLRTLSGPAPNEENLFLLPDRFWRERTLFQNAIQPFDLMSRRHPLSSTRATGWDLLQAEADRLGPSRRAGIKPPAILSRGESYFFFFATLRVFFAVFFTALFAFFAFLAFFAMLPSNVSEMA
jgi:hypothetical protein